MAITDVSTAESAGWRFVNNAGVGGSSGTAHPKWGVRSRKYTEPLLWEKPKPKRVKAKPAEPDHRRYMTKFINREMAKLDARNRQQRAQTVTNSASQGGLSGQ